MCVCYTWVSEGRAHTPTLHAQHSTCKGSTLCCVYALLAHVSGSWTVLTRSPTITCSSMGHLKWRGFDDVAPDKAAQVPKVRAASMRHDQRTLMPCQLRQPIILHACQPQFAIEVPHAVQLRTHPHVAGVGRSLSGGTPGCAGATSTETCSGRWWRMWHRAGAGRTWMMSSSCCCTGEQGPLFHE